MLWEGFPRKVGATVNGKSQYYMPVAINLSKLFNFFPSYTRKTLHLSHHKALLFHFPR